MELHESMSRYQYTIHSARLGIFVAALILPWWVALLPSLVERSALSRLNLGESVASLPILVEYSALRASFGGLASLRSASHRENSRFARILQISGTGGDIVGANVTLGATAPQHQFGG